MDPIFQRTSQSARIFAALVAFLMLVQTTSAGAVALGGGVAFGTVCAPQDAANGELPLFPNERHRHGFCCVVHNGALDAPPSKPVVSIALIFPTEAHSSPLETSSQAPRIEPRRAPQSPRAPPRQG
ncbi:hypothetical protein D1O30_09390 [Methylocystis hirsuta]|uniref:DUF2946 domain-containing protein n=1 Tax=Methylocystis hirsuta TaxID=369798 RepID=A0A3M9XN95_9HYPH|nr:hypothetical protein D1O30_09390 [Methylocystis hirsuta]